MAQFLLTRGDYGYMGYGWHGCVQNPPPSNVYDYDYGAPAGLCTETSPGVFTRQWTKATITMCVHADPRLSCDSNVLKPKTSPVLFRTIL